MNLHEYQAKRLLAEYGIAVPVGEVVSDAGHASRAAKKLGGNRWVVKAQVHAGGRGKAGGVRILEGKAPLKKAVGELFGSRLVTNQTAAEGQPVHQVLIEQPCAIARELYLGAVVDRSHNRIVFLASTEGGIEIERIAAEFPEKILRLTVDPLLGVLPFQCRGLAYQMGLDEALFQQFTQLVTQLGHLFIERDLSLLEINPLAVTKEGDLLCLDAKIRIDDNALYRQPQLGEMRDPSQENERENRARQAGLSYIALDGEIGCMVNGAGLAMATMDLIKLYGGSPANFLDVGGTATTERVTEAFKIILSDKHVKAILINIFGGIVRCDIIAEGVIKAVSEVGVSVPVVVRLAGTRSDVGAKMLADSGYNLAAIHDFAEAAERVVAVVKEGRV